MKKRIPILLLGNFLSKTTGTRGVCEDLAERLTETNWQVIIASDKPGRLARLLDMVLTIWRNQRNFAVAQVDVYSGPSFFWAELVCLMLRVLRKPYILTLHGGNLPAFARRWPGRVRGLLLSASMVITPSNYLMEAFRTYCPNLCLIPNPLELSAYHFKGRTHIKPRLVWLRGFHNIYHPQLAPQVVALLAPEFPKIKLIMVGPDKKDGSLQATQEIARVLNVDNNITFTGAVPKSEVPFWLDQGDIFLNTSNVDNTPVSVMEAMASGLCIVSTAVGGIQYLLDHEKNALMVPANNAELMATAVRRILTEPGLGARLSHNARRKAAQFDWSVILPKWEELFEVVGEKGVG